MKYPLYYPTLNNQDYICYKYTYYVSENLQDIIEYLYKLTFHKDYGPLNWYLEDGAKEFVKQLEKDWWSNKLDTFTLYEDFHFKDWLTERYADEALKQAISRNVAEALEETDDAWREYYL